jgi:tripeptide aminopeptidase
VLGSDDKSGLAQIIEAVTVIGEHRIPHGDIEIVMTAAEEVGLVGAVNLDFGRLRSRHALVLDSSGPVGTVVTGAPTHIRYVMTISGRSAHAGIEPEKGINAIRVASRIISEAPDGRIDDDTTANIGIIEGGSATNIVAQTVTLLGEIRGHRRKPLEETQKAIFGGAARIARQCGASIAIEKGIEYSAFRIPKSAPFLGYLRSVYREIGIEPRFVKTGGGSDANIFNQRGIMAINISNGMQKVHSSEEFIMLDDLYKGCEVALKTASGFRLEGPAR